jgi:3-hydroxyisobutyrate dehydrogenase-like beta-hydroxyacid dehydrogenase
MAMSQRIGFAGLGLMGSRMARNLLKKGFETTVWNRSPGRSAPLAAQGARVAATPRELAERSDVLVACVADPPAVERLVFAPDGLLGAVRPGFRYLECSTVSPDTTRRVQAALRGRGADALEAPVTGSKNGAEQGTLLFMTGGARAVHDELMPVMMAMGTKAIYCGEMGQGSTMKLIGNSFISLMLEALCEGIVVGRRAGLPLETILEVVQASGFASPYFAFKGAAIAKRDFDEHFAIDLLVKDQNLMLETAGAARVPMPGLAAVREVFQSARAQGYGREDICAVVKALERAAGFDRAEGAG